MEQEHRQHELGGDESNERRPRPAPRIYVASLTDYNRGRLFGRWMDADATVDELSEQIAGLLAESPSPGAEEWAIHDYEGFGPLSLSEYEDLTVVSRVARGIAEHGEPFAHWARLVGTTDSEELDRFEETYLGAYETAEAYAEQLLDDLGYLAAIDKAIPEGMQPYVSIDVVSFARDLELGGDITTAPGSEGVYVFDMNR